MWSVAVGTWLVVRVDLSNISIEMVVGENLLPLRTIILADTIRRKRLHGKRRRSSAIPSTYDGKLRNVLQEVPMSEVGCFKCRSRRDAGKCIVARFQLEDVKVGEWVTVHFSASGIGSMSMTGMLDKEYRTGDQSVSLEFTDGFAVIPAQSI